MAIRAPMMKEPEAATDVFDISAGLTGSSLPSYNSNFPVDMALTRRPASSETWSIQSRMTGARTLQPNSIAVEGGGDVERQWDYMNGWGDWTVNTSTHYAWNWKRAKGYFDVVTYSGNATSGRAVPHSLGVAPEMIWVKARDSGGQSWRVYHASLGATHGLNLNGNNAAFALTRLWNDTAPTNSSFIVGNHGSTNDSSHIYIAYLFATLPGISKVGQVTIVANVDQDVDCGFSAGARFLLIKRFSDTGHWDLFDTKRGIVAGNDPRLQLNRTNAQYSGDDYIDISPYTAGFTINGALWNSGTYIFYAIA